MAEAWQLVRSEGTSTFPGIKQKASGYTLIELRLAELGASVGSTRDFIELETP